MARPFQFRLRDMFSMTLAMAIGFFILAAADLSGPFRERRSGVPGDPGLRCRFLRGRRRHVRARLAWCSDWCLRNAVAVRCDITAIRGRTNRLGNARCGRCDPCGPGDFAQNLPALIVIRPRSGPLCGSNPARYHLGFCFLKTINTSLELGVDSNFVGRPSVLLACRIQTFNSSPLIS